MTHSTQKVSAENRELVKRAIAKAMPTGADDGKLKGLLAVVHGFQRRRTAEYLQDLLDAGEIEWDIEQQVWRLPT